MSETPRRYDVDKQPDDNGDIEMKFSMEQTAAIDRALRLFAVSVMIDSDTTLSMEDATMVVGYISRGHQRQLTLVQSPEKLEQLVSLLRRASIETEDPKELTADMVAADIEATITIHGLGDTFDNVSVEDFLNR